MPFIPTGSGGGAGTVTSVTAADTSVVVGGTAAAPTVRTNTVDVIAADHPAAADWSNNSHKITSLANGTAASDAAAFGQIPVQLAPTSVKTGAYNAAAADLVICNASSNFTVTLPTAPADKTSIGVVMVAQTAADTVTVACGGSDVINVAAGATSVTLGTLNQVLVLQYAATPAIWYIVAFGSTLEVYTTTAQTITSKRITKRTLALSANSATPAINTDLYDVVHITAQTAAITSFTTNLTGTPVDGDSLRVSVTGTAAVALTWGASFAAGGIALPTSTYGTTRLDVGFVWDTAASGWVCCGSTAALPGTEIGYTQITSNANITDTSEATATALISPGALTFDGGPVLVEFFTYNLVPPTAAATNTAIVTLFEGATQITRLAINDTVVTAAPQNYTVRAAYRFTPSAGSHTYKICAFVTSTTGTPTISAGSGGTNGVPPAFVRFTKV